MRVICRIRDQPHYRRYAFEQGIQAAGHQLVEKDGDALVIWNRYGTFEQEADRMEAAGGAVLVAENGYYGTDDQDRQFYALARHGHNGSGDWVSGAGDRWARFGVDFADWRRGPGEILVCPQRGIGPSVVAQPRGWGDDVARRLRAVTKTPVRIRLHPGNQLPTVALNDDLRAGVRAVVVWSSNCATAALLLGIPVFYEGPAIVTAPACNRGIGNIDNPNYPDRLAAFRRMAWAQWSVEELESGEPFDLLLRENKC